MHFNISNIDSHGTHIHITKVKIYSPPDKIQNSKHHLEQHFLLQVCIQFIIRVTEQTDKPVALPSSSTHPLPIVTTQNKITANTLKALIFEYSRVFLFSSFLCWVKVGKQVQWAVHSACLLPAETEQTNYVVMNV